MRRVVVTPCGRPALPRCTGGDFGLCRNATYASVPRTHDRTVVPPPKGTAPIGCADTEYSTGDAGPSDHRLLVPAAAARRIGDERARRGRVGRRRVQHQPERPAVDPRPGRRRPRRRRPRPRRRSPRRADARHADLRLHRPARDRATRSRRHVRAARAVRVADARPAARRGLVRAPSRRGGRGDRDAPDGAGAAQGGGPRRARDRSAPVAARDPRRHRVRRDRLADVERLALPVADRVAGGRRGARRSRSGGRTGVAGGRVPAGVRAGADRRLRVVVGAERQARGRGRRRPRDGRRRRRAAAPRRGRARLRGDRRRWPAR